MALSVLELKLVLMGVIFLGTTMVGVSPILLKGVCGTRISGMISAPTRARLLSCASCFSAGVFLFVCFMGLLPAADNKFHLILKQLGDKDSSWEAFAEFPWGFFIVTCGFLVIFTIDKLVHAAETGRANKSVKDTNSNTSEVTLLSIKGSPASLGTPSSSDADTPPLNKSHSTTSPTLEEYVALSLKENKQNTAKSKLTPLESKSAKLLDGRPTEFHLQLQEPLQKKHGRILASEACVILEKSTPHHGGHGVPSSLIFLVALGIHSLFEGAAIGLQTQREKVLEFGVAVLVHEVVMAFTFGLEVSRSRRLTWVWQMVYVGLFTISIPLGIAMGAGLMQNTDSKNSQIIAAVMEAIATGIFLHVIFVEIIAKEFPDHHGHNNANDHQQLHHHHHPEATVPNYQTVNGNDTDDNESPKLQDGSGKSLRHTDEYKRPSEVCLVCEKILCICAGLLLLILLNVFMHSDH